MLILAALTAIQFRVLRAQTGPAHEEKR